jgi:adenylate cyclase
LANFFKLLFLIFCSFFFDEKIVAQPTSDDHATPAEVDFLLEKARNADSPTDAIEQAKDALKMARDIRFSSGERQILTFLGINYDKLGESAQAIRWFIEAANLFKTSGQTAALADIYGRMGDIYFREKLFDRSLQYYRDAADLRKNDPAALEKIGDSFAQKGRPDSARTYYVQVLSNAQKRGEIRSEIRLLQKLADAFNKFPDSLNLTSVALNYMLRMRRPVELLGEKSVETVLFNNIACQFTRLQDFPNAVEYFQKVELQCGYITCDKGVLFTNLGIALHNSGRSREGIEYLLRANSALETAGDLAELPHLEHLIARTYLSMGDTYNALSHNETAIKLAKLQGQQAILAQTYRTEAELFSSLFDFEKALDFFQKYLNLQDQLRLAEINRQQRLEQQQFFLQTSEKEYQLLLEQQKVQNLAFDQLNLENEKIELANRALASDKQRVEADALALLRQNEAQSAEFRAKALEALKIQAELTAKTQTLNSEKKDRQLAEFRTQEQVQRLEIERAKAEQTARNNENQRLRESANFQTEKQKSFKQFVYGIGAAGAIIGALLLIGFFIARRANRQLARQKAEIEHERHESDRLLHAILPEEVATELKIHGTATPRFFEEVTILFTDFVNFTHLTEKMRADELLSELNACFFAFDEITERHGLEKIKTIGDSYMAAGGVPVENQTHPIDAVNVAIEMLDFLKKYNENRPPNRVWQMRIGIHTGSVVAGVVGKNKFAWDIWGDAVNTAARLEQSGQADRVNISGSTYARVQHAFRCTPRGSIAAKNKGEILMYFVETTVV